MRQPGYLGLADLKSGIGTNYLILCYYLSINFRCVNLKRRAAAPWEATEISVSRPSYSDKHKKMILGYKAWEETAPR